MKIKPNRLAIVSLILFFSVCSALAAHKIVNNSDKPLLATTLTDSKGIPFAGVYIPSKGEMIFGDDGWPVSGAGWIEAKDKKTYYVPFMWNGKNNKTKFGGFHVERIEWDKTGLLISVSGLQKQFESDPNMEISSDIANPKIIDGILYLKFKDKGDAEYKFKTSFGKGVMFSLPDGF